jgi:hypothetical protein
MGLMFEVVDIFEAPRSFAVRGFVVRSTAGKEFSALRGEFKATCGAPDKLLDEGICGAVTGQT